MELATRLVFNTLSSTASYIYFSVLHSTHSCRKEGTKNEHNTNCEVPTKKSLCQRARHNRATNECTVHALDRSMQLCNACYKGVMSYMHNRREEGTPLYSSDTQTTMQ